MAKPIVISVHDWVITPTVDRTALWLRPSTQTVVRQLWVTLACGVVIVGLCWWFGLPPGASRVDQAHERVAELEKQLAQLQRRRPGLYDRKAKNDPSAAALLDRTDRQIQETRTTLDDARAAAESARPTLGPVGDGLFYAGIALLLIIGIGLPLSSKLEWLRLDADGDRLHLRTFLSFVRARTLDTQDYAQLVVTARRKVHTGGKHRRVRDLGWEWVVTLLPEPPDDPGDRPSRARYDTHLTARPLELHVDLQPNLPLNIESLTTRTRDVVRFLEAATGLTCQPPVTHDITDVERGLLSTQVKGKIRRHGPVTDPKRHRPLDE